MNSNVSTTRFDPASTLSALDAVFAAVSEVTETDAMELRRIDRYINADVIDLLFGGPGSSTTHIEEGALSFRYDDVIVTVTHDGWIEVCDADAFKMRPAPHGPSAEPRTRQLPEASLGVATAALVEAEEHVWTAARNASDDEVVDPLWAAVERLWSVRKSLEKMDKPSSTGPPTTWNE